MPQSLFVIDLNYTSTLKKLDEVMKAHVKFLDGHYERGHFITSGRKVPRSGGIIIAVAENKAEVESWMQEDPFYKLKLSEYSITEYITSQADPIFRKYLDYQRSNRNLK